jgi:hypothetical protein
MSYHQAKDDYFRVNYFSTYLSALRRAVADGVDIRGYFAWSLVDNFEYVLFFVLFSVLVLCSCFMLCCCNELLYYWMH